MILWDMITKSFVIGTASSHALQSLLDKQNDINANMTDDQLNQRYKDAAKISVEFANALWEEIQKQ